MTTKSVPITNGGVPLPSQLHPELDEECNDPIESSRTMRTLSICWIVVDTALVRGYDTRFGLEDTLRMPDGSLAHGNVVLVRAVMTGLSH